VANSNENTPNGSDGRGNGSEMGIYVTPKAITFSGDHAHTFSYSGTTGNHGGGETRPENMAVNYFIKL
jgi:hypothetical protein